ncbi:MAG: Bug family tripartite tricarboxylate transporter substrate binding protein [Burkholderiales bacterium]
MNKIKATLAALTMIIASPTWAQSYPSKPVRIIIPGAAGAPPDILSRAMGPAMSQALGQAWVVENRVGANGIIGMEAVVRSNPDGYTLSITQGAPVSLNPYFYTKLPYEPLKDLAPIANMGVIAASILVSAATPVNSMRELVDMAKAKPETLLWSTWGPGSFSDLYRAWTESYFNVRFQELPYKASSAAFQSVIAGEGQVMLNASGALPSLAKAGKIKVLATIGPTRYRTLPEVPSFAELGYDMDFRGWVGAFAPTGTSRDIVQRLNTEINKVLADSAFGEKFLVPASVEFKAGTPEEFGKFLKVDRELAARLTKLAKVKPE